MVDVSEHNIITDKLSHYEPEQKFLLRKRLVTGERGKQYALCLNPARSCAVYQVDGYMVAQGTRCDKLVLVAPVKEQGKWSEVFVELKGSDIKHAIEQLRQSIMDDMFKHECIHRRYARVVAQKIPRNTGNSVVERARDEFRKYDIELKCWSSTKVDSIE